MKKAISMMLATAMAATCLAGCGSAASSSAAASSEAASSEATSTATSEASTGEKTFENNELNIAVFEGGYGSEYWDEIIKRFEAAYPGVTVNMQISPKIGDIIRPQIVAGNVPDFISMNDNDSTGLISSMVKEHALMDLSDVFEEGGIDDDTPLKDQVIDGLLDSAKCSPYGDGKIYIAPFDASPMGLVTDAAGGVPGCRAHGGAPLFREWYTSSRSREQRIPRQLAAARPAGCYPRNRGWHDWLFPKGR